MSKKIGMVIDLHNCVGCGACALACKNENNTQARSNGQSFNWADFTMKTEGVFPDVTYVQTPVLCNHCTNAPCVEECPVEPKAMFKAADGSVIFNEERCIGCGACQAACPYSAEKLDEASNTGETYSVISFFSVQKACSARMAGNGHGNSRMHVVRSRGCQGCGSGGAGCQHVHVRRLPAGPQGGCH